MGWSSGTEIFEKVIDTVKSHVDDFDARYSMYIQLIDAFQDADWDNMDEVVGLDPAYDKVYKDRFEEEEFEDCKLCYDEHPTNVLEDGLCPFCIDEDQDEDNL